APAPGALTASTAPPQAAPTVITPPAGGPAPAVAAPAAGGATDSPNPEDYAPATDAAGSLGSHVRRGTESGVPLYQDQAATPGVNLPQLRLDLHVYAVHPEDRFVMINMRRLREGDSLPGGVRVESITPEGAIMSYNGSRFLLPRE
ncbi:MAG TPA: general secretion pathway protein GspB, partial [Steroidobacteraceae bacterium]|nr:general secretion pathway protein GspB [Steroidobacteraceae bacterium]